MFQATVIVLEVRPRWVPELKRQFQSRGIVVRGARSPAEACEMLAGAARGLLIVELDAIRDHPADALQSGLAAAGAVPVIVIASRGSADLEWAVRELGAFDVLSEETSGETLAAVCMKQWGSDKSPRTSAQQGS